MKKLIVVFVSLIFLPLLVVGIDRIVAGPITRRAHAVRIGDTRMRVEQLLGSPTKIFRPMPDARTNIIANLLSVESETWAYGSSFDFSKAFQPKFPYFSPGDTIRLRFFKPEADDIAIAFDSSGRVSDITIP